MAFASRFTCYLFKSIYRWSFQVPHSMTNKFICLEKLQTMLMLKDYKVPRSFFFPINRERLSYLSIFFLFIEGFLSVDLCSSPMRLGDFGQANVPLVNIKGTASQDYWVSTKLQRFLNLMCWSMGGET